MRDIIEKAGRESGVILFIDEIHRFNKAQQDALLGAVETGKITLIGATTENPSFEVNSALLSRCQVYVLKALEKSDLEKLCHFALKSDEILKQAQLHLQETEALLRISGGDARKLLNLLELLGSQLPPKSSITDEIVMQVAQQNIALYDKKGEQHYDIISAFIKSMRGSDPNAAVYWLARMMAGGEDVKFIARRMLIFASEDIGNANPNALLLANATFDAVHKIGHPESRIILSQCAIYLASSEKSNSAYMAIEDALSLVKKTGDLSVPLHIRNGVTGLMKNLNYGKGYAYDHAYEQQFAGQEFLPESIQGSKLYEPGPNTRENEMRKLLKSRWKEKYGY
jgi:putative ATPase